MFRGNAVCSEENHDPGGNRTDAGTDNGHAAGGLRAGRCFARSGPGEAYDSLARGSRQAASVVTIAGEAVALSAWSISSRTRARPSWRMSKALAADADRSMIRPRATGPRSLIRTTTERPVSRLVTRTWVPNGSERWAAVRASATWVSPSAVGLLLACGRYQEASPSWKQGGGLDAAGCPWGAAHRHPGRAAAGWSSSWCASRCKSKPIRAKTWRGGAVAVQ